MLSSKETGNFCHGDSPTMADCCLMPQARHIPAHFLVLARLQTLPYRVTKRRSQVLHVHDNRYGMPCTAMASAWRPPTRSSTASMRGVCSCQRLWMPCQNSRQTTHHRKVDAVNWAPCPTAVLHGLDVVPGKLSAGPSLIILVIAAAAAGVLRQYTAALTGAV